MRFLKKMFKRKRPKTRTDKKQECWYNNSQEIMDKGMGEIPMDTSALASSSMYMQSSKQLNH